WLADTWLSQPQARHAELVEPHGVWRELMYPTCPVVLTRPWDGQKQKIVTPSLSPPLPPPPPPASSCHRLPPGNCAPLKTYQLPNPSRIPEDSCHKVPCMHLDPDPERASHSTASLPSWVRNWAIIIPTCIVP
ncbi:hypothetical protein COCVIDRAFT_102727, partial [Bipolaris victoriae FI3]